MNITNTTSSYTNLDNNELRKRRHRHDHYDSRKSSNHSPHSRHRDNELILAILPLVQSLVQQLGQQEQSLSEEKKEQKQQDCPYSNHQLMVFGSSNLNFIGADDLFETIENSLNRKATEARVRYNAVTGRPEYIFLDLDRRITEQKKKPTVNRYYALYIISPPNNIIDLDDGQKTKASNQSDIIYPSVLNANQAQELLESARMDEQRNSLMNKDKL